MLPASKRIVNEKRLAFRATEANFRHFQSNKPVSSATGIRTSTKQSKKATDNVLPKLTAYLSNANNENDPIRISLRRSSLEN